MLRVKGSYYQYRCTKEKTSAETQIANFHTGQKRKQTLAFLMAEGFFIFWKRTWFAVGPSSVGLWEIVEGRHLGLIYKTHDFASSKHGHLCCQSLNHLKPGGAVNLGQETKKQVVQVIYAGNWCERGRCGGKEEKETADLLWQQEKMKEIEKGKKKNWENLGQKRQWETHFGVILPPNYPQIQHKAIIYHLWASAASFNSLSYSQMLNMPCFLARSDLVMQHRQHTCM